MTRVIMQAEALRNVENSYGIYFYFELCFKLKKEKEIKEISISIFFY